MHEITSVMKFHPTIPLASTILLAAFWLAPTLPVSAGPEPEKKPTSEKPGKKGEKNPLAPKPESRQERGGGDPLRHLSPEERNKFREAMRQAWDDPAVLQARDEVKEATIAYQKALTEAISRTDPDVVSVLKKIRDSTESPGKNMYPPGGGPGDPGGRGRSGGGSGFRDFEAFLTGGSPSFLNKLSEQQREIYRDAREKALKSPEFQEVFGVLRKMRMHDDELRNKRIELFGRARQTLNAQMLKADKRVKEFLPKEHLAPKGPPPNGRPGPGSGPPRKRPDGEGQKPPVPREKKSKE
jgi:hypothetical protein